MYKFAKQLISLMVTIAMLFSMTSIAAATDVAELDEGLGNGVTDEATTGVATALDENAMPLDTDEQTVASEILATSDGITITNELPYALSDDVMDGKPVVEVDDEIIVIEEPLEPIAMFGLEDRATSYFDPTSTIAGVTTPTTYEEVYDRIVAMQEKYPEGLAWTNYTPYGSSGPLGSSYRWHGGRVAGKVISGVGCAAFTFILSDIAFGNLPAKTIARGDADFTFANIRVGDILRIYNNSHSVIVLKKSATGVIVAEANYNSSVHWGRALSEADVMAADFIITRYPDTFVPADAPGADEVAQSGTEGSLNWTLTNAGTLTISGSGAIPDFSANKLPSWSAHNNDIASIVIKDGITGIGNYAFYQSKAMDVYMPDGVTNIGQYAFAESSLIAVTIPGTVKSIGEKAFYMCPNLTSVTIADGVATIGEEAFRGCTTLAYIDIPASVTTVGAGAFMSCSAMTRVRFMPGSEKVVMGDNLFSQCWYLVDVTLPQTADCISVGMFQSCSALTRIYIPAGVSDIGSMAFTQCFGLEKGGIYFGGSEETWNRIGGVAAMNTLKPYEVAVYFDVEFDDPFAKDPNDPGDLIPEDPDNPPAPPDDPCKDGHTGTADADGNCTACGKPIGTNPPEDPCRDGHTGTPDADGNCTVCGKPIATDPPEDNDPCKDGHIGAPDANGNCSECGKPMQTKPDEPGTDPTPETHKHSWAKNWSHDSTCHWHQCEAQGCPVVNNSEKDGHAKHSYGGWVTDLVATSSQSGSKHRECTVCAYRETVNIPATGGPSGGSGSGSSSGGSGSSGGGGSSSKPSSITTTTIDKHTGAKTQTTKNQDGSTIVTVTQKNGTVTTTTTDTAGKVQTEVKLSATVVSTAKQSDKAAVLPISAVTITRNPASALAITVQTDSNHPVKVAIPATRPTMSTVAVLVNADGSTEIIKASVVTSEGIVAPLADGATVKIVDNSKSFTDVPAQAWYGDAVAFVSARELFAGTTADTFAPSDRMTRGMLMTVLARFDGEETAGGTTWYEKGVSWAVQHGISDGASPNSDITREQLVTMLWRYQGSPRSEVALDYTDLDQVSGYAEEAMRWAVQNHIVSGFGDGRLGPQAPATRAQVAQILKNLINNNA